MIHGGHWAGVLQPELSADDSRMHHNNIPPTLSLRDEHKRARSFRDAETNISLDGKGKKRLLKERMRNERGGRGKKTWRK